MKIFVCEFITGGGLYREPLPASLAREGLLMRDALLRDLAELADVEVLATYDERIPPPRINQALAISTGDDIWQTWNDCIRAADAVWLIAPETDGILLRLTELVESRGKTLLGSASATVALTSSKWATCRALQSAGIAAVPTYRFEAWPQQQGQRWVAKPDDGVGCSDSAYFDSNNDLQQWMRGREATHVIQPFQPGAAASLCVLCKSGQAWLLSCNLQDVALESGNFRYKGSILNGAAAYWQRCELLAQKIAQAIPGLTGYVGIDFLLGDDGMRVLEINPRLTTSYVGLRAAMDCNPARLIVDLLYNERFRFPENLSRNVVEIKLNVSHENAPA